MLGIICGLKSEAKVADRISGILVGCAAAKPDRALALARHMVAQRVDRLISFGLAAGLSEDLVAGDLVLGGSVMTAKNAWESDQDFNAAFLDYMPSALCVPVWGSQTIVQTMHHKEMIYKRSGCLIADMESHGVARAAQEADIPFSIIRAISDPFDVDLPPAAMVPLKEDGGIDRGAVFASIKKEPAQLFDLVRLGLNTAAAMRSLKSSIEVINHMDLETASGFPSPNVL